MSAPQIKGWCPGALTPMESGDGLVVRVRPFHGHLSPRQIQGLHRLSSLSPSMTLELTSRANIQFRGVAEENAAPLRAGLEALHLLDATPEVEARRNILVSPFWQQGSVTEGLARALTTALCDPDAPQVPHKFGFAIDTGPAPVLATASADIRLEREAAGGIILVADGAKTGKPVSADTAVAEAIALARWFLSTAQGENRIARLLAKGAALPAGHGVSRISQTYRPRVGDAQMGTLVGVPFGQLDPAAMARVAQMAPVRLTPWRMLLLENPDPSGGLNGLITDPNDPRLRISACTGAPRCPQGLFATRPLAQALAGHLPTGQTLHVSGCTKGCAHPKPADITITGSAEGLSLIRKGRASDTPLKSGLTADQLTKAI